jgi:hypothetical protein
LRPLALGAAALPLPVQPTQRQSPQQEQDGAAQPQGQAPPLALLRGPNLGAVALPLRLAQALLQGCQVCGNSLGDLAGVARPPGRLGTQAGPGQRH